MHTTKLSVAVLALGALAACHAPKDVSTVSLMALEVKAPGSMFSTGSVVQLEADGFFSNGTRERLTESVSWSSSDESIASVDGSGLARMLKAGTVTFSAQSGALSHSLDLQVSASRARSLELFPSDLLAIAKGLSPQLHAYAVFADGTRREVTAEASWAASGDGVMAMAERGRFRFDAEGDVTVSVRFGSLEASQVIRVQRAAVVAITLEAIAGPLKPGQRVPLKVNATYTDGAKKDVTMEAWVRSLDVTFAQVADGIVTAVSAGRARLVADFGGFSATRAVDVEARRLVSMVGTMPAVDLPCGRVVQLQVIAGFDDGASLDVTEAAQWESSNPAVAEVLVGTVSARTQGSAEITASYGGQSVVTSIFAQAPVLEQLSISLPNDTRLVTGQAATFAIYGHFSDGADLQLSSVATVRGAPAISLAPGPDDVTVRGLFAGAATIEVEVSGLVRQISVEVTDEPITRLEIRQAVDEDGQLSSRLQAFASYADGVTRDVTELCEWISSDFRQLHVSTTPGQRGAFRGSAPATITAEVMRSSATFSFVMP